MSRHNLDLDSQSWQFQKLHLGSREIVNSFKNEIWTVEKLSTINKMTSGQSWNSRLFQKQYRDSSYGLLSLFESLSFDCRDPQAYLLITFSSVVPRTIRSKWTWGTISSFWRTSTTSRWRGSSVWRTRSRISRKPISWYRPQRLEPFRLIDTSKHSLSFQTIFYNRDSVFCSKYLLNI